MILRSDLERAIFAASYVRELERFPGATDNSNAEDAIARAEFVIECYRQAEAKREDEAAAKYARRKRK